MEFAKVVRDIRDLKVQGAENVAKAAVNAFYHIIHKSKATTPKQLYHELNEAKIILFNARATEPCMRNAINYVLHNIRTDNLIEMVKKLDHNIKYVDEHFRRTEEKIQVYGENKIKKSSVVFTHCHSSAVMSILKHANRNGKKFEVHATEARPRFQGRLTAEELSKAGIPVKMYVDSAARLALKKADICLFGADAIQSDGKVINKIGTEMFAEIAHRYEIPVYHCTDSWKMDPASVYGIDEKIEQRKAKEVWDKAPKGVQIINPSFEKVNPENITGIISELGQFRPEVFVQEVRRVYPWVFER